MRKREQLVFALNWSSWDDGIKVRHCYVHPQSFAPSDKLKEGPARWQNLPNVERSLPVDEAKPQRTLCARRPEFDGYGTKMWY